MNCRFHIRYTGYDDIGTRPRSVVEPWSVNEIMKEDNANISYNFNRRARKTRYQTENTRRNCFRQFLVKSGTATLVCGSKFHEPGDNLQYTEQITKLNIYFQRHYSPERVAFLWERGFVFEMQDPSENNLSCSLH